MDALKIITEGMIKEERPHVKVGDVVKVHVKIREGERERIQVFEGTIIAVKGSGVSETFTVRRVSYGVGVERVFPVNSPNVAKVELVRAGIPRIYKAYLSEGLSLQSSYETKITAHRSRSPDQYSRRDEKCHGGSCRHIIYRSDGIKTD